MKTIIAGSRNITDIHKLINAIDKIDWEISIIVSGAARGVDRLGEDYARLNNIPVMQYPARWAVHGKKAGYIRNLEMAHNAEALIALWDGKSKGTKHMIDIANMRKLKVFVYIVREEL